MFGPVSNPVRPILVLDYCLAGGGGGGGGIPPSCQPTLPLRMHQNALFQEQNSPSW